MAFFEPAISAIRKLQLQLSNSGVQERYPRRQMKTGIAALLRAEAQAQPRCRIAFMMRHLGFENLILRAPVFAE